VASVYRELGGRALVDIANREIPKENMIEGIWWRSLGPGPARKVHRQSKDCESRGVVYRGIESTKAPIEFWLWSYGPPYSQEG
jgi:hypothetical protein